MRALSELATQHTQFGQRPGTLDLLGNDAHVQEMGELSDAVDDQLVAILFEETSTRPRSMM